jgi:hypothetical protein
MSTDRRDSRVRWNMDMDMGGEVERGDGGKVYRCIGRRCDQVSSMRDEERRGGEEAGDVVAHVPSHPTIPPIRAHLRAPPPGPHRARHLCVGSYVHTLFLLSHNIPFTPNHRPPHHHRQTRGYNTR